MVMELKVLGSSSKGNCYLLDNGSECLVIECGVPFIEVKKALNFDISRINGVIVSHEHQDHAREVEKCLSAQIPCYMSRGTSEALNISQNRMCHQITSKVAEKIGRFRVIPFDAKHDAKEPFGFLINHPEMGTCLFATDTYYLHFTFSGLNHILLECNYRKDILDANVANGRIPMKMRNRTLQSHCSFETCLEILKANDLTDVRNIVLIHLSDGNSNAKEFKRDIETEIGKPVFVADKGLVFSFSNMPF